MICSAGVATSILERGLSPFNWAISSILWAKSKRTVDNLNGPFIFRAMTDEEALDFLAAQIGIERLLAALSTSVQRLHHWRARGISAGTRPLVWAMINDHGGHLPREWLFAKAKPTKSRQAGRQDAA